MNEGVMRSKFAASASQGLSPSFKDQAGPTSRAAHRGLRARVCLAHAVRHPALTLAVVHDVAKVVHAARLALCRVVHLAAGVEPRLRGDLAPVGSDDGGGALSHDLAVDAAGDLVLACNTRPV